MGLIYADIQVANAGDIEVARRGFMKEEDVRRITVHALVDSGAYMLALPAHLSTQLGLPKFGEQEAQLADGTIRVLDRVGPVELRFANRSCLTSAMVLPEGEALLGAIPMEDLDVIIHPLEQKLVVNPENPYIPKRSLKQIADSLDAGPILPAKQ